MDYMNMVQDLVKNTYYLGLILGALAVLVIYLAGRWLIPLYIRLAVRFLERIFPLESETPNLKRENKNRRKS